MRKYDSYNHWRQTFLKWLKKQFRKNVIYHKKEWKIFGDKTYWKFDIEFPSYRIRGTAGVFCGNLNVFVKVKNLKTQKTSSFMFYPEESEKYFNYLHFKFLQKENHV